MSKYTLINKELESINEARFQQVCNLFLKAEYGGTLHSPGTVPSKEKTRKGKPDTYIQLPRGKYILAEVTTQDPKRRKSLLEKLESDLRDCLKFESLGIKPVQVELIALCCNGTLLPEDLEYLQTIADPYPLKVHGIQDLTFYLYNNGKVAARDLLGISFDTGQVLTREQFMEHYHRKNLSTPLNTTLVGRQRELKELTEGITASNLVVVKGPAGVGKSRLVLEAIGSFLSVNSEYTSYYIFDKQVSMAEDLLALLEPSHKYLFFVDDANRQINNFLAVINSQLAGSMEQVKIVATVRDYAKEEVLRVCRDMKPFVYEVQRLDRETIIDIIANDFGITEPLLQNRIAEVSEGNPRLAIMAALAFKEERDSTLLNDVSYVYDRYFQTIIDEKDIFRDKAYLKALGLLAYFHAIDLESDWVKQMLNDFGIPFDSFFDICHQLEEMELVEIYLKYTVKISEQVLSTYFFYRVFFKEAILPFPKLLDHYFAHHVWRMRESFYSANNAFGDSKVLATAKPWLEDYFARIKEEEERRQQFLEVFGIYLPLRVFYYFIRHIEALPMQEVNSHMLAYLETRGIYNTEEPIVRILEPFFTTQDESLLTTALDLSLQYVVKNPEVYALLGSKFRELFAIKEEDGVRRLRRQQVFFTVLRNKIGDSLLISRLYFETGMAVLLDIYFPRSTYTRNNAGKLVLIPELQQLRAGLWHNIRDYFPNERTYSHSLLMRYLDKIKEYNGLFYYLDAPFVKEIIETHLHPQEFGDAFFVFHYHRLLTTAKAKLPWLKETVELFHTDAIRIYLIMTWEPHETYTWLKRYGNWGKVIQNKITRIRKALPAYSIRDYKKVYTAVREMVHYPHIRQFNRYPLFEYYLAGIIKEDAALGLRVFTHYLEQGNEAKVSPGWIYSSFKDKKVGDYEKRYTLLSRFTFFNKEEWLHQYFQFLPEAIVNSKWVDKLVAFYQSAEGPLNFNKSSLAPFIAHDPELLVRLLNIVSNKRVANKQFIYKLDPHFFKENRELVRQHFTLCAQVYLQLEEMENHFDQDAEDFMVLYEQDPEFLELYTNYLLASNQGYYRSHYKSLEKLWQFSGSDEYIRKALEQLARNERYYVSDHLANVFFTNLQPVYHQRAFQLLQHLITLYPVERKTLDMVFDIARNCLRPYYHQLFRYFLELNPDFELFKQIRWLNNHWSGSGNEIWSDFKAAELRELFGTVKELPGYHYYEHLIYLDKMIIWEDNNSTEERKAQFMGWR